MSSPANPLLDKAKAEITKATNLENSFGGQNPANGGYKDKPAPVKKSAATPQGTSAKGSSLADEAESAGKGIAARKTLTDKALGNFHTGGTVPKSGAYKLLKGEKVVPPSKAHLKMTIRPTDNDKYIAKHEYMGDGGSEPGEPSMEHGLEDLKEVHKHIETHFGKQGE